MQQSAYNDMQLLQQHVMFKQLQELQQQQQLQQLGDMRQQNSLNQLSAFSKQTAGGQFPSLINGTPVHDTSQVFRNWVQRGASPAGQGIPNRVLLSQEQGQALHSMGGVPQLHDISLFGTPIANARGNLGQYSQLQELSNDSVNLMSSASGQLQKPTMQSSSFNNPFLGDRRVVSGEQVGMSQGACISKQGSHGENLYGQVPVHGLNTGGFSGNAQEGNTSQTPASLKEFAGKQDQVGWPSMQQTTKQLGPSPGFVPLDPMEEKILYNMDDNIWDASFGRHPDMDTGFSGNSLEHTIPSNTFPSIQSGSWSALMQSAVAESSSSDTGLQEEWSGLTVQNAEQSNDNLLPNFMDSEKQQTGWVDSKLPNTSFNSKPFSMFNDGNINSNSSFPGFQQAAVQFLVEGREGVCQDGSREAIEYCNLQPKSSIEENQRVQSFMHLDNSLVGQIDMHSESSSQNQRIASQNNVGQLCGKLEGNRAMDQRTFPDGFLWKGDGNRGASSFSRSIEDSEQVQSGADHSPPKIENSQTQNFSDATNSNNFKAHLPTNHYVPDSNPTGYKEHITVSVDRGNERVGKIQQVGNSPLVTHNYYGGTNATYEKQQNCYQNESTNNCYTSKEFIDHAQVHFGHFKSLSDVSRSSNLAKGCLPDLQRSSTAQEVATSRGDHISTFHSQNMLELLHKVDQSRDDSSLANFGSIDCIPSSQGPRAETTNASSSQLYTQSSSSQGFGLRLASPSQQSLNSNLVLSSQSSWKTSGNLKSEQVSTEFGVKSPTWLSPQSVVQSLPTSQKLRQEAHCDNRFGSPGHTGNSSNLNMQRGSNASVTPSPPYFKNQLQMHFMSGVPQSSQGVFPNSANRYPHFNRASSQDISQHMFPNPLSQQIPVLGNVQVSQPSIVSGMSQQGEISAGPDSLWRSFLTQQQPLDVKSLEVSSNLAPSSNLSNNGILSTSAPQGSTDHNSEKCENYGASSVKTQAFAHEDKQVAKERSLQQTSVEMPDATQISGSSPGQEPVEKLMSGAAGLASGSLVGYSHLHEPDRIRKNDNPPEPVPSGNSKMLNFLTMARESLTVKALQQPAVRDIYSQQTAGFGQNVSQDQSGSNNAVSNTTDRGQIDLQMAPSWFKQYGTLRNGQMVPIYEAVVGKTAVGQLSLGEPSQNSPSPPSIERLDGADAIHGGRVWPRTAATLGPDKHLSAPYVLPSDAASRSVAILRWKKRKLATIEPLPWHKEVIEGFRGVQTICMAEQEWAQAANRLIEKAQYQVEMIEDVQQPLRSKRRLIMTTQLMHQLFRPAPATLILADVTSHYESVSYFVSKLAVGDACSLTNCAKNSLLVPLDDDDMKKLKDTKKCSDQQFSEVVEELMGRANKLENEFQRLDKSASIVDLRVECQDLERFALINRFAKFHSHSRAQVDTSGASFPSSVPRSFPQRYVSALPMPRNVPEGVQCLSL